MSVLIFFCHRWSRAFQQRVPGTHPERSQLSPPRRNAPFGTAHAVPPLSPHSRCDRVQHGRPLISPAPTPRRALANPPPTTYLLCSRFALTSQRTPDARFVIHSLKCELSIILPFHAVQCKRTFPAVWDCVWWLQRRCGRLVCVGASALLYRLWSVSWFAFLLLYFAFTCNAKADRPTFLPKLDFQMALPGKIRGGRATLICRRSDGRIPRSATMNKSWIE